MAGRSGGGGARGEAINRDRFAGHAVPEVYANLRNEGEYVCRARTMDRGKAMQSQRFIALRMVLGVERSYSRPHGSNDNLYAKAQLTTLKYHGTFPKRFVRGEPSPRQFPAEVWINQPKQFDAAGLPPIQTVSFTLTHSAFGTFYWGGTMR